MYLFANVTLIKSQCKMIWILNRQELLKVNMQNIIHAAQYCAHKKKEYGIDLMYNSFQSTLYM